MNNDIYLFSTFSAFIINELLAAVVLSHNFKSRRNLIYGLFCMLVGLWALCCFFQTLTTSYHVALIADYFLFSFAIFTPVLFVDFINTYTNNVGRKLLTILYILAFLLFLMNFTPIFRIGVSNQIGFRYITVPNFGWYAFNIFYTICATIGLYRLSVAIKSSDSLLKTQLKYVFVAFVILVSGGSFYLLFAFNIKTPPIDNLFNVLSGLMITYIITKTRLMDITVVIRKGTAWFLSFLSFGLVYVCSILLYRHYIINKIDLPFILLTVIYGVVVGELFQKFRLFLQTTADKAFVKGWYDYRTVQRKISTQLRKAVSLNDAIKSIHQALDEEMDIQDVDILLPDDTNSSFIGKSMTIPVNDELVKTVIDRKKILTKTELPKLQRELCVPCFSSGDLSALIILGKKRSEDAYSNEDMDMLQTISDEISDTFLRIKPYEKAQKTIAIAQKAAEDNARLAALGTLAAGLAHEIRNPMMVLRSKSETVRERLEDREYISSFAKIIPEQIDRIIDIINRMLKFAKAKAEEMEKTNVNKTVEDTISLLESKLNDKGIKLEKELSSANHVMANPVSLSEALFNIMLNAVDFTGSGGRLSVRTFDEGGNVAIRIEDAGIGMTAEQLDHIFEPFYTSRAEGTGLGLSIAHRNITDHKGRIEVTSRPGKGTVFNIYLPAV